jgi:phosphoglucosamine mutase
MVTTPTLAMSMKILGGDCGVMITASHNTPEYIGIKLWNPSGLGFTPEQEAEVEQIYNNKILIDITWDKIGYITNINDINSMHVEQILKLIHFGPNKRTLNIIVDPGNGSSCEIAPLLLKNLGCKFVTLNSNPDGHFPGRLSEPNSKNLQTLVKFLKGADDIEFGCALDGDADRVIFIDGKGKIIEPIRMLTFLAKQILLHDPPTNGSYYNVMTPINSSSVLEYVLHPLGANIIKTEVGDIKVAIEIKKQRGIIGGENAGTYIWPTFHYGPDSLVTIAKVVELLSYETRTLTELLSEIPEFPFVQKEFNLLQNTPFTKAIYERIRTKVIELLKEKGFSKIKINELDGIRIDYEEGWLLIRRSGTSPIVRIAGEHIKNLADIDELIDSVTKILKDDLGLIKK